jgi:hypothetical protein
MAKKAARNRSELLKEKKEAPSDVAATDSVRELNGILYRKGRKPVSIEEMDAAIAKGASRSMSRAR